MVSIIDTFDDICLGGSMLAYLVEDWENTGLSSGTTRTTSFTVAGLNRDTLGISPTFS